MIVGEKIKLKVCGMRDEANIMEVATISPDYMGFIFYEGSPRYVGRDFLVPAALPAEIRRVGVFVNERAETIVAMAERNRLDLIQLHGNESPQMCASLKNRGFKVIKAFGVDGAFDFSKTSDYREVTDFFLFDTRGPLFGGNATSFDWKVLERFSGKRFFLGGGISAANIAGVIALGHPDLHAVDVNSGAEVRPGVKDPARVSALRKFVDQQHE